MNLEEYAAFIPDRSVGDREGNGKVSWGRLTFVLLSRWGQNAILVEYISPWCEIQKNLRTVTKNSKKSSKDSKNSHSLRIARFRQCINHGDNNGHHCNNTRRKHKERTLPYQFPIPINKRRHIFAIW